MGLWAKSVEETTTWSASVAGGARRSHLAAVLKGQTLAEGRREVLQGIVAMA